MYDNDVRKAWSWEEKGAVRSILCNLCSDAVSFKGDCNKFRVNPKAITNNRTTQFYLIGHRRE